MKIKLYLLCMIVMIFLIPNVMAIAPGDSAVSIDLSFDGGTTYTNTKPNIFLCSTTDSTKTFGSSTDTWGRTWNNTEFSNSTFRARINLTNQAGDTTLIHADHIRIKVYYSSIVYDFSNNNANNGTPRGNVTHNISGGYFGGAYDFDGINDFIRVDSDAEINAYPFTLSAWVNKTDDGNIGTIISIVDSSSHGNYYGIRINQTAQIFARNPTERSSEGTTDITDEWHQVVGVFESNTGKSLYVDGEFVANLTTSVTFATSTDLIDIGRLGDLSPSKYLNGTIDEVAVWNRSLNLEEIQDLYRLRQGKYFWKVNITDFASNNNESVTREFNISDNIAPTISNILINETTVYNDKNIRINATITDADLQVVYIAENATSDTWTNNTATQDGNEWYFILESSNLENQENVSYYIIANDTSNNIATSAEFSFFVENRVPDNTTLLSPTNASSTTDRTPTFSWSGIQDPDNKTGDLDPVSYLLQVDKQSNSDKESPVAPDFLGLDINTTVSDNSSTITEQLEADKVYYWRVRVNSSQNSESNFSAVFQLTVDSDITITMIDDSIVFQSMSPREDNDTLDDSPPPFSFSNDGNVFINVSINATDDLWTTQSNPSDKFQFRPNETSETGSYDKAQSPSNEWSNIPPITGLTTAIVLLNYTDTNDSAEIEIRIEVPPAEPNGTKTTTINFLAELASTTL